MKMKTLSTRYVLTFAFAVLTAVILVGAVGRRRMTLTRSAGASNQQEEQRVQTPVPSVISEVKELKIAQVFVDDQKQLIIVLLNKTGKGSRVSPSRLATLWSLRTTASYQTSQKQ